MQRVEQQGMEQGTVGARKEVGSELAALRCRRTLGIRWLAAATGWPQGAKGAGALRRGWRPWRRRRKEWGEPAAGLPPSSHKRLEGLHHHCVAARAHANPLAVHTQAILDPLHIPAGRGRAGAARGGAPRSAAHSGKAGVRMHGVQRSECGPPALAVPGPGVEGLVAPALTCARSRAAPPRCEPWRCPASSRAASRTPPAARREERFARYGTEPEARMWHATAIEAGKAPPTSHFSSSSRSSGTEGSRLPSGARYATPTCGAAAKRGRAKGRARRGAQPPCRATPTRRGPPGQTGYAARA